MSEAGAAPIDDARQRMKSAVEALKKEFGRLRTGRASSSLLEGVKVEAYGQTMPLSQMASVSVVASREMTVQVWDKSQVGAVEKAILSANLGLTPTVQGELIHIAVPPMSQEGREEVVKRVSQATEQARVAVRNVRRDAMDKVRALKKDIGEDQTRVLSGKIEALTTDVIASIDDLFETKQKEVMQI